MSKSHQYFDPETLSSIHSLELRARTLVEGLMVGMHRSPLRGQSIEFAQHREYMPGDDIRQIDWKVYARSDKYHLRQYEDETSLDCIFILDQSESMAYRGESSHLSKREYGQLLVCCLSYLIVMQGDSVGLATFSAGIDDWLPPSASPSRFEDIIRVLDRKRYQQTTGLAVALRDVVQRARRPSLLVVVSDFLDDADELAMVMSLARHARHDLLLVQILDRDELDFDFEDVLQFCALEESAQLPADARLIAGAYRKAVREYCQQLEMSCRNAGADYAQIRSDEMLSAALPRMLASRRLLRS